MRCKLTAKPGQIESRIDPPHQVIVRHRIFEVELVEELTLLALQTAHHGSTSPRFVSTQRNHGSRSVSTDFCNKIGTKRTWGGVCYESVMRTKADIDSRTSLSGFA